MNPLIKTAVANGWISFPEPREPKRKVLATSATYNAKRAYKMWQEGQTEKFISRAIGIKKRFVKAIIEEGRP